MCSVQKSDVRNWYGKQCMQLLKWVGERAKAGAYPFPQTIPTLLPLPHKHTLCGFLALSRSFSSYITFIHMTGQRNPLHKSHFHKFDTVNRFAVYVIPSPTMNSSSRIDRQWISPPLVQPQESNYFGHFFIFLVNTLQYSLAIAVLCSRLFEGEKLVIHIWRAYSAEGRLRTSPLTLKITFKVAYLHLLIF